MSSIKYIKEDFVGKLIISNPLKKNAINFQMWKELSLHLDKIAKEDLRVLIIMGEGDNFSAGADISQFSELRQGEFQEEYDKVIYSAGNKIKNLLIPTIAYVKGYCFGGGFGLVLKCDFRIAREDVVFCLPAVKRGIGYNKRSIKDLVEVVGLNNAREILLTGRRIDFKEGYEMGLITNSKISIDEALDYYVNMLLENAPLSIKAIKAGFLEITENHVKEFSSEKCLEKCFKSEDYIEATNAFIEKRKTNFTGK